MSCELNAFSLSLFIDATLPMRIAELQRKGGVTQSDIDRAQAFADVLGAEADVLLFGGGVPGQAGRIAGQLVDAIAVMSFVAGENASEVSPGRLDNIGRFIKELRGGAA